MVAVSATTTRKKDRFGGCIAKVLPAFLWTLAITWFYGLHVFVHQRQESGSDEVLQVLNNTDIINTQTQCPVVSIASLSEEERNPSAGTRHMVTPPSGGNLTLVCCQTTKGPFSLLVHENWAPLGAHRMLGMVRAGYFSSGVPLFKCTDACQFGLSGDPSVTETFNKRIQDDINWMPPGPDNQHDTNGVLRFPAGFWTYAGSGPNSRTNQFVLTLKPNKYMGGGQPWEVPIGELVGNASFETMSHFYTEYKMKGPSQKVIRKEGFSDRVQKEWPKMDSIMGCSIADYEIG